jgi:hypothetical protein
MANFNYHATEMFSKKQPAQSRRIAHPQTAAFQQLKNVIFEKKNKTTSLKRKKTIWLSERNKVSSAHEKSQACGSINFEQSWQEQG